MAASYISAAGRRPHARRTGTKHASHPMSVGTSELCTCFAVAEVDDAARQLAVRVEAEHRLVRDEQALHHHIHDGYV